MEIEAYDEIPSPSRCARCGHSFMPDPGQWVFCPACHACHASESLVAGLDGAPLVSRWLQVYTDADPMQRGPIRFLISGAEALRTPCGFPVLVAWSRGGRAQGVVSQFWVRLAGFAGAP